MLFIQFEILNRSPGLVKVELWLLLIHYSNRGNVLDKIFCDTYMHDVQLLHAQLTL